MRLSPQGVLIYNRVNNVLGFPYIFRGAQVRASSITRMKIAAAEVIAPVPEDVPDATKPMTASLIAAMIISSLRL